MLKKLKQFKKALNHGARMMVGIPDYDAYVRHITTHHPEREVMSYEAFFRERQTARYAGKVGKCC